MHCSNTDILQIQPNLEILQERMPTAEACFVDISGFRDPGNTQKIHQIFLAKPAEKTSKEPNQT